jgi:hypothetical protein
MMADVGTRRLNHGNADFIVNPAPSQARGFLDLPPELLLLVIGHLNEHVEGLREPDAAMYIA